MWFPKSRDALGSWGPSLNAITVATVIGAVMNNIVLKNPIEFNAGNLYFLYKIYDQIYYTDIHCIILLF